MADIVPADVIAEVVRQQEAMGWPDMVPMYAELQDGRFMCHEDLTVADCEQVVEWRIRRARLWLRRHGWSPSRKTLRNAARNILLARLYRCQYITLIGKTDSTEADMPFPLPTTGA